MTLGSSQREAFQILLDGEPDKVLHPERPPCNFQELHSVRPDAVSGTRLLGPTMRYMLHGQNMNWVIDGREKQAESTLLIRFKTYNTVNEFFNDEMYTCTYLYLCNLCNSF